MTGGLQVVEAAGRNVAEVIDDLERKFPGLRSKLRDGDSLKPGLAVVIGTQVARLGLLEPVPAEAEVHFVPAIGGG